MRHCAVRWQQRASAAALLLISPPALSSMHAMPPPLFFAMPPLSPESTRAAELFRRPMPPYLLPSRFHAAASRSRAMICRAPPCAMRASRQAAAAALATPPRHLPLLMPPRCAYAEALATPRVIAERRISPRMRFYCAYFAPSSRLPRHAVSHAALLRSDAAGAMLIFQRRRRRAAPCATR